MGRISMPQGKGSLMHNRREYGLYGMEMPDNIDTSRSGQNIEIVPDEFRGMNLRKIYEKIFGDARKEHNNKRPREVIDDYYDHIRKSKNGEKPFYEDVLQWGDKDDFIAHPELRSKASEALQEYARTFQQRNPNLILISAFIHADEASPHMHIDYIPVAHGYKRGMKTRNGLDRAIKEMGMSLPYDDQKEGKKNNVSMSWKDRERAYFGEICKGIGLSVDAERHDYNRISLSPVEYGMMRDRAMEEIDGEREMAEQELQAKKKELKDVKQQLSQSLIEAINAQDDAKEAKAKKEKAEKELKEAEEALESTQKALNDTRIAYERESQELKKLVKERGIQQEENESLKGICDSLNQSLDKTIEEQEKAIADAKAKMGEMNRPRHKGR